MTLSTRLAGLEDELRAVVRAGEHIYRRGIAYALDVLLAANPALRENTAVELYRHCTVTLARAVELAGLEREAFKERLAARNMSIVVDETLEEVFAGAEVIHRLRVAS